MFDIDKNWEMLKTELKNTNREGIDAFITYLETETDFKTAPASTKFHLCQTGGLVEHTLNVLKYIREEYTSLTNDDASFPLVFNDTELAIVALCHDLCKTNYYIVGKEWDKEYKEKYNQWREKDVWKCEDKLPLGHGEKSVIIANRYVKLSNEEMAAMRWHMMAFDPSIHFNYPNGFPFRESMDKYPLLKLLVLADMKAELFESLSYAH